MEELTEAQTAELAALLRKLKMEISEELGVAESSAKPVELDQASVGRVSRMDALQQQHLAAASRHTLEIRLSQISAALTAVERETYGFCRACEEPIGYRRLKARPETPLCLACQAERQPR